MSSLQSYEIFHLFFHIFADRDSYNFAIMEQQINKTPITGKAVWTEAMKFGAILGVITIILDLVPNLWAPTVSDVAQGFSSKAVAGALTASLITMLYSLAKMALCIWIMVIFTKKLVAAYDNVTSSETFRFGMFVALLSGLIVSAAALIQYKMMDPEVISEAVEQAAASRGLSSEGITDMVQSMMPFMVFLFTLLKCALVGIIAALIISRSIPGRTRNPFEDRM